MNVDVNFEIKVKEKEGISYCYIPETDCYYSAKTDEEITRIGKAMIRTFVKHWNDYNGGECTDAKELFDSI